MSLFRPTGAPTTPAARGRGSDAPRRTGRTSGTPANRAAERVARDSALRAARRAAREGRTVPLEVPEATPPVARKAAAAVATATPRGPRKAPATQAPPRKPRKTGGSGSAASPRADAAPSSNRATARAMGARMAQAVRTASPGTTARGAGRASFGARRVSGPAVARAALAIPAGSVAAPAPVRRPVVLPKPPKPGTVGRRVGHFVRGLPDHSWLDRLVRGRAWIVVLGIALIGIVAMQVSELKLNAGIGRAMAREETLRRDNAALLARVSSLSANYRVQEYAVNHGFVFPDPGQVRFLPVDPKVDAKLAAHRMSAPTPEAQVIARQAARPTPAIGPATGGTGQ